MEENKGAVGAVNQAGASETFSTTLAELFESLKLSQFVARTI